MSNGERPRSIPVQWIDPVAGSPIEVAIGVLFGVAGALVGMVWGAAWLSANLIGDGGLSLSAGQAAVATVDFGRNGLRWGGIWDPDVEDALVGPFWFWLFFAIQAFLLSLLFWPIWKLFGPRPAEPMPVVIEAGSPKHPRRAKREASRTAAAEQQEKRRADRLAQAAVGAATIGPPPSVPQATKIVVERPTGRRLILGKVSDRYLATDKHHSTLALGPTRSGKTSGLGLPALVEWRGPALVVAAKGDLVLKTWKDRHDRGDHTWLYDPTGSVDDMGGAAGLRSLRGYRWSPLKAIEDVPRPRNQPEVDRRRRQWSLARRTAGWMIDSVRPNGAGPTGAPGSAHVAAEQILGPLLLAAAAEELPLDTVVAWVDGRDLDGARAALGRVGVAEAITTWESAHRYDEATTTAAYQVLTSVLFAAGDPMVAANAREPEIATVDLVDGGTNTLYVLAPPNHHDRLRPMVSALVHEVADAAMAKAAVSPGGRLAEPLLIVIDDTAQVLPAPLLDQLASLGAGMGIQLLTMVQDLGHLSRAHGHAAATQLADSHRARVVLPGITDPLTLEYLNAVISGNPLVDPDAAQPVDLDGGLVSSTASWMRTLDDDAALLIYGNLAPIRMKLRPWYRDEGLRGQLLPPEPRQRRIPWFDRFTREAPDHQALAGIPGPLNSSANDAESDRYWQALQETGSLPEAREFDDGTGSMS
ncbi:MAG: type IV secretory system conjugative DNA transfer family protein [Actinomycetota bacterium]